MVQKYFFIFDLKIYATLASTFEFMLPNITCVIARLNQHFKTLI